MKIIKYIKIVLGFVLIASLSSCISARRVNNLQDMTHGSQIQIENKFEAVIAPYDELGIFITTTGSMKELAAPFNSIGSLGYENGTYSAGARGYLVDINGNIQMPVLGEIHVAGLTRLRLQDTLTAMLKNGGFLDEPFVSVRFNNFKIFFLGNGRGSVINISNERCTFLEAMAMLGDFDLYTRRDRIGVMREINGKMVMRYLDPRSSDIFNDPFFMLQQNDFIITETFTSGLAWSEFNKWIGIVSTVLSLTSLVTSIAILTKMK